MKIFIDPRAGELVRTTWLGDSKGNDLSDLGMHRTWDSSWLRPPPTSMHTQASSVGSVFDDSSLWQNTNEPLLGEETSLWVPVATTRSDTWNLLLPDKHEYTIHGGAMEMIIFLELCFSANGYGQQTVMKNRLAHYILRLRKLVQKELDSTPRDRLLDITWQPKCLWQWAVRVNHGFSHCSKGREAYEEYCARHKWQPYRHDNPLTYGKFDGDYIINSF